ncbi:hypothetical protein GF345_04975 [Candidatus Woesearchaeota archaeon]|nr:hypothetical protein [Candidatus Woesearchaeota archaeon]
MANKGDQKLWAFLAVFLSIIGFIIALLVKKDDKYVMYYAKQSLIIFIASVVVSVVGSIVPFIGWFIVLPIGSLIVFVLWIMGLIYSVSGEMKPVPLIGKYGDKFDI